MVVERFVTMIYTCFKRTFGLSFFLLGKTLNIILFNFLVNFSYNSLECFYFFNIIMKLLLLLIEYSYVVYNMHILRGGMGKGYII